MMWYEIWQDVSEICNNKNDDDEEGEEKMVKEGNFLDEIWSWIFFYFEDGKS